MGTSVWKRKLQWYLSILTPIYTRYSTDLKWKEHCEVFLQVSLWNLLCCSETLGIFFFSLNVLICRRLRLSELCILIWAREREPSLFDEKKASYTDDGAWLDIAANGFWGGRRKFSTPVLHLTVPQALRSVHTSVGYVRSSVEHLPLKTITTKKHNKITNRTQFGLRLDQGNWQCRQRLSKTFLWRSGPTYTSDGWVQEGEWQIASHPSQYSSIRHIPFVGKEGGKMLVKFISFNSHSFSSWKN